MAYHSYNHGLVTSTKGMAIEVAVVTDLDVAPAADAECTVDDYNSNLIQSVIHSATGVYDVQLNKPYPPALTVMPSLSVLGTTVDLQSVGYMGDYDADAGTFSVVISNDDDVDAPVAQDGYADTELTLLIFAKRYTNI
jgi:hypothetical protein